MCPFEIILLEARRGILTQLLHSSKMLSPFHCSSHDHSWKLFVSLAARSRLVPSAIWGNRVIQ